MPRRVIRGNTFMALLHSQPAMVFDVECYRNFFLIVFKDLNTGLVSRFQISPNRKLNRAGLLETLRTHMIVGFNSNEYDVPMIQLALKGYTTGELKEASDDIIVRNMKVREFAAQHEISKPNWNHVDLIQVAPLKASLKIYAGRLHCKKMQDLPIDPHIEITAEQAAQLFEYCCNDLENTGVLFRELEGQIELRRELSELYGQDLRSRSDAQVAEHIIAAEVRKINGYYPGRPQGLEGKSYQYQVPAYVSYRLPQLREMLEKIRGAQFVVGDTGAIGLPADLEGVSIRIGGGKYKIGIGGLHSSESNVAHVADDRFLLIDRDVTSYYPSIILNQGLFPKHLGEAFLTVYQSLVTRRIEAKKAGDKMTAESLKIAVNGSFGKLGNKWSVLYAPDLLIQVTLTGQLALFMLIEMVEAAGVPVVSANTDGILIKCPKTLYPMVEGIIAEWEKTTGFATEETRYSAVYSKDVNNYLAIKTDGKVKGKGLYANPWEVSGPNVFKLQKNPSTTIVIEAVIALLRDGIPLDTTIKACRDITKFIAVRSVTGGANKENAFLGKAIRWYYSVTTRQGVINYKKSGYKVPKSDGAKPLMELPDEFPDDVNYNWYLMEARSVLGNIGYAQPRLFEAA